MIHNPIQRDDLIEVKGKTMSLKLIMPMAGNGQRFFDAGYNRPKPLIDIKGKPMFKRVIDNLGMDVDPVCIVRQDHVTDYEIDKRIIEHQPNAKIIITPGLTEGAACTVRLATSLFNSEPMMVANCDQLMVWDDLGFNGLCASEKFKGGIIPTFIPKHEEPIHSYVRVDENNEVIELAEKKLISNIATVGVYYFGSESEWCAAHAKQMDNDDRTNGEFYLAPTYNYISYPVGIYPVDHMIGMGTPEELDALVESEWMERLDEIS